MQADSVYHKQLIGVFRFYRDTAGQATLKEHGFMTDWARRAGKLVLQEAEELHEDSVVTYVNLALFWHAEGLWRLALLHKGTLVSEQDYFLID